MAMASETSGDRKVALVTGSTSGIGLTCARGLARRGCDVIITGLGEPAAIEAIKQDIARY